MFIHSEVVLFEITKYLILPRTTLIMYLITSQSQETIVFLFLVTMMKLYALQLLA